MKFEWDVAKADANPGKHRVSFDEAGSVFLDHLAISGLDPDHSVGESRNVTFGISALVDCLRFHTPIVLDQFASLAHGE